jgi:hypothetical protein
VKRIACERPRDTGVPVARWSLPDLRREVLTRGLVATVSGTTLWRWLDADAIRPWRHRSWLFPRDPRFADRAGPILDLYQRRWMGRPLGPDDYVISADEKTSIQARERRHASAPVAPGRPVRVEHEYRRHGAWAYLAAWDVHRARLFGRCEPRSGIAPFDRLVDDVMTQEPYRSAQRVFWVLDNGSAHRGVKGDARLQARWPTIQPVHTPLHASWLNQIEIYFSVVQRKVLTPNDFATLTALEHYLLAFNTAIRRWRTRFAGPLRGETSSSSSPNWRRCGRPHDRKYVTVIPEWSTKSPIPCNSAPISASREWSACRRSTLAEFGAPFEQRIRP